MNLKQVLRTSFCPTAVIALISGNPVHTADRRAQSENCITPSTLDKLIHWSIITASASNEKNSFFLLNGKGTEAVIPA